MMGTINFVLIGARNTGKTCYLSVLASHCPGISTAQDDTTTYIKMQRNLLEAGKLPQATASTMRELFFRYTGDHHKVDFSVDDYDGSFIESLSSSETSDDESREALKARIQESEGLLFFMPYETQQDEEALSNFEYEINTIISLVEEITQGKYATLPIPAVICVSKWDRSPDYKKEGEKDAVITYLDNNSYYRRACSKIKKLFEHVSIQPISAFGSTADGTHPNKGKIDPYKLEEPLNYCLVKTFQRYEQKIEAYQQSNDDVALFDYLFELYDDLKHHKDGEYCRLYDQMELKLSSELLSQIHDDKETVLSDDQELIRQCIRQESLLRDIEQALQSNQSKRTLKKVLMTVTGIATALGIGIGALYVTQSKKEHKEFASVSSLIANKDVPSSEMINKALGFNHHWKSPMGLPLPSLFLKDCQSIDESTSAMIRTRLKSMETAIKSSIEPDKELINKITAFNDAVAHWSDDDLHQTVQEKTQPILESYQLVQRLSVSLAKTPTLTLDEYHKLRNSVADAPIKWNIMDSMLNQIYLAIAAQIKSDANDALASGDLRELEGSKEDLADLNNDGDSEAGKMLQEKVIPAYQAAKRQESLQTLLTALEGKSDPEEMKQTIGDNFVLGFSDEQKTQIYTHLQQNFEQYEDENIPVQQSINSRDGIKGIRDKLNKLNQATMNKIYVGDDSDNIDFRYQRPDRLDKKIKKWENKLKRYEITLEHGISGYVTFKGRTSDDDEFANPLGFNCSASDHDLIITIDNSLSTLPNDTDKQWACANLSVKWKIPVHLKKGVHTLAVEEHDYTTFSDEWSSSFLLPEAKIFEFINKGQIVFNINPYSLIFSKR